MTQSSEYPDLRWIPPAAYGSGRDGKAVRYIVIHYTAGSERSTSAEDGAAYDQSRTDGTSTHYFADSNSVVQCVLTKDRANAARTKGNRLGIQYELCGTVQTRAQWLDDASLPTLQNAARQAARDCKKYELPVRRLSVAETRAAWYDYPAGPKGIVGHVDCTNAYPEDGGDHTDPGSEFPWDVFLDMVRAEMEGDMALTDDDLNRIARAVWAFDPGLSKQQDGTMGPWPGVPDDTYPSGGNGTVAPGTALGSLLARQKSYGDGDKASLAQILATLGQLDEQTARAVLAGLPPAVSGILTIADLEAAFRTVLRSV